MTIARQFAALLMVGALMLGTVSAQSAQNQPGNQQRRNSNSGAHKGKHQQRAGQWLRKYQNVPADEQEKQLNADPKFQSLSPEKQERLRERLHKFNDMTPEQKQKTLDRMQKFEQMTPEQRQRFQHLQQTLNAMPQARSQQVRQAFRHLQQLSPDEQQKLMGSSQFRTRFNDQERGLLNEMLNTIPPKP